MPSYDSDDFQPPAPLARVTLRALDKSSVVKEVPMLLDTGADVSLVPRTFVERLALPRSAGETFELVGFDGSTSEASAVDLEMIFCARSFRGQYLLTEEQWGILGRNVLNLLPILFDGPGLAWTLSRPQLA